MTLSIAANHQTLAITDGDKIVPLTIRQATALDSRLKIYLATGVVLPQRPAAGLSLSLNATHLVITVLHPGQRRALKRSRIHVPIKDIPTLSETLPRYLTIHLAYALASAASAGSSDRAACTTLQ